MGRTITDGDWKEKINVNSVMLDTPVQEGILVVISYAHMAIIVSEEILLAPLDRELEPEIFPPANVLLENSLNRKEPQVSLEMIY